MTHGMTREERKRAREWATIPNQSMAQSRRTTGYLVAALDLLDRIERIADDTRDDTDGFPMEVCAGKGNECRHPEDGYGCEHCRLAYIRELLEGRSSNV